MYWAWSCAYADVKCEEEEKNYDFDFFFPYVTSSFLIHKYIKIKTEGVLSLNPFKFYNGVQFDLC